MADWWTGEVSERYWCEITDREDVGGDLKSPQGYEDGREYWSYSLLKEVWPGDIVFHYSTKVRAFQGISVAGGPLEERDIVWVAHGTVGQSKVGPALPRPGWWLPLYGYRELEPPLTLTTLRNPTDEAWIRDWITEKSNAWNRVAAPFQRYGGPLRASQGYLTKMPREFVQRWPEVQSGADSVSSLEDRLTGMGKMIPPPASAQSQVTSSATFQPKSDADYVALIKASVQRRSRKHERLVREVGEWLQAHGKSVSTPHPKDLEIAGSPATILEGKIVGERPAIFAVREATAQLLAYRYFLGPQDAQPCVLLDTPVDGALVRYVEEHLGMMLAWWHDGTLSGGPRASAELTLSVS